MITKEAYVLNRVKSFVDYSNKNNEMIQPAVLNDLIKQWSFDYEAEKTHRPEVLKEESLVYFKNNHHCCNCDYKTTQESEIEADADRQLQQDGGFNAHKKSRCPKCKKDSLIFLTS